MSNRYFVLKGEILVKERSKTRIHSFQALWINVSDSSANMDHFPKGHKGQKVIIQFIKCIEIGVVNISWEIFHEENKNLKYQSKNEVSFSQVSEIISKDFFFHPLLFFLAKFLCVCISLCVEVFNGTSVSLTICQQWNF